MIDFEGLDQQSQLSYNVIDGYKAVLILLRSGNTSLGGSDGIPLIENYANCYVTLSGCTPLEITYSTTSNNGAAGAIEIIGGVYTHCGGSACANILIKGDGVYWQDSPNWITLVDPYVEGYSGYSGSAAYGVECYACRNLHGSFLAGGNGLQAALYIANTASIPPSNIKVRVGNPAAGGSPNANYVYDAYNGVTVGPNALPNCSGNCYGEFTYSTPEVLTMTGILGLPPRNFSTLPACSGVYFGAVAAIGDSTDQTWGDTICASGCSGSGGGSLFAVLDCDAHYWRVMGK